jgi:DMSO/TMAO reductase YedYZ heme-binding membrane subunit
VNEQVINKNSAAFVITGTLAFSIGCAVLRYHIVGPVLWTDFPMFILNKSLCLAAFVLLTMNFALGPLKNLGVFVSQGWLNARKAIAVTGFLLVMLHALIGFLLFSAAVYSKFFAAGYVVNLFGRE